MPRLTTSREQAMYVDYVFAEGNYWWHNPAMHEADLIGALGSALSCVFRLTSALREAGFFSAPALLVIAKTWRRVVIGDELSIHQLRDLNATTLEALDKKGLLADVGKDVLGVIVNEWIYPLYPLDLRMK